MHIESSVGYKEKQMFTIHLDPESVKHITNALVRYKEDHPANQCLNMVTWEFRALKDMYDKYVQVEYA